jgi:hypothetical protein
MRKISGKITKIINRNTVKQISEKAEESESNEADDAISPAIINAEIEEFRKQLLQLDWSGIDPVNVRDSPYCKSVCNSNVIWFLFSEAFFPKNKLFMRLDNLQTNFFQKFTAKHNKEHIKLMSFLTELSSINDKSKFENFSKTLIKEVILLELRRSSPCFTATISVNI